MRPSPLALFRRRVRANLLSLLCAILAAPASVAARDDGPIVLLKHPYPYRASFAIISDLHRTTIAEFEAVHKLVNTRERIEPDSPEGKLLGFDTWAPREGRKDIQGFGFPFGDSFLFYDPVFAWFRGYDPQTRQLIADPSNEIRSKFEEWYRKGYIESIHTFGGGPVTREWSIAATDYLLAHARPPIRVWVNHSKGVTPDGVADVCCSVLNQLLVQARYAGYYVLGLSSHLSRPAPWPPGSHTILIYLLFVLGLTGATGAAIALFRARPRVTVVLLLAAAFSGAALHLMKVDYYLGDNPGSEYYNLDQVRRLGVRYFWTVNSDYWQSTVETIDLPEFRARTGRPSIFRVHRFNDGSQGLGFMRNTIDTQEKTLGLLTASNLEHLVDVDGRAVFYMHWLTSERKYFDSGGIRALETLADFVQRRKIWAAPSTALLDHAYAYSYLKFTATTTGGAGVISIEGFDDPILGPVPADIDRLANVSFRCRSCSSVDVKNGGAAVAPSLLRTERDGGDLIVTVQPGTARYESE